VKIVDLGSADVQDRAPLSGRVVMLNFLAAAYSSQCVAMSVVVHCVRALLLANLICPRDLDESCRKLVGAKAHLRCLKRAGSVASRGS
jgi:hypothetical protein